MAVWQDFPRVETILDHLTIRILEQGNTITEPATQPYITPINSVYILQVNGMFTVTKGWSVTAPHPKGQFWRQCYTDLKGQCHDNCVPTFFLHDTFPSWFDIHILSILHVVLNLRRYSRVQKALRCH